MSKEVELTQGKFAIVDDGDYQELNKYNWHYAGGYAIRNGGVEIDWKGNPRPPLNIIRHATPSEIERRFFARHGREPWELKRDDVLLDKNKRRPVFVDDVIKEESNLSIHVSTGFIYPIEYIKENHRVISFVGGRLDVKTNE